MGYEFKLKESEARMMKRNISLIAVVLIMFMTVVANAQQELNPTLPTPAPEVEQTPQSQWRQINRAITCNAMGVIRNILENAGQVIYASGIKSPEYLPMDPFDGVIITRNEITLEYTVLLIKSDLNVACVLAGGQRFELIEDQM